MEAPERKEIPRMDVVFMKHSGSYDEIGQVYRSLYKWAREHNITVAGKGLTVFLNKPGDFNPAEGEFEVCLPFEGEAAAADNVGVKELPARTVASVTVKGPYGEIPAHYTELLAWLSVEGWAADGCPREVYLKRPDNSDTIDPDAYLTEIQIPVT